MLHTHLSIHSLAPPLWQQPPVPTFLRQMTFSKKSWWLCSCRSALHLQVWKMTFPLCIVLVATKHILFADSNPRGRIQTYYCGRKQIKHKLSITWVRQLISITANGIYASIQLSMVLKICTSFWPQILSHIALKDSNKMQIKWMLC